MKQSFVNRSITDLSAFLRKGQDQCDRISHELGSKLGQRMLQKPTLRLQLTNYGKHISFWDQAVRCVDDTKTSIKC